METGWVIKEPWAREPMARLHLIKGESAFAALWQECLKCLAFLFEELSWHQQTRRSHL